MGRFNFPEESGIYCFENLLDGKRYVGQGTSLKRRMKQHEASFSKSTYEETCGENRHLWYAVKKYGLDNFAVWVVEYCDIERLDILETFYIIELESHSTMGGYNVLWGGFCRRGVAHTQETREKLSKILKGKKRTPETKQKMSGARKGYRMNEESIKKMVEHHAYPKGKDNPGYGKPGGMRGKHLTEEQCKKISDSKLGIPRSEETKEKLREYKGENHWAYGRKMSEEEVEFMSERMIGIKKTRDDRTSDYLGVSYYKKINKWKASVTFNREEIYLGVFPTEIEAALAYNEASLECYGWKAKLNFITEEERLNLWEDKEEGDIDNDES